MKLFKFEGYKLTVSEEALLLTPFKAIWKRDKSVNKSKAMMELGFIYFFCDVRSDYQYITDEEERKKAIKEGEGMPKDWQPDNIILSAIEFYNSFKSSSELLLEDTRYAVDKLRRFLRYDVDLSLTDDKGKPIYTINSVTSAINQIPVLIKNLDEAERSIAREIAQSDKVRGTQTKSMYEDPQ